MHETAYAKLNLALHVRGRQPDGYHDIETVFAFVEDGDQLTAEPADTLSLRLSGPFGDEIGGPGDNLALRAAQALQSRFGVSAGASIRLEKRLPVAAGLGGGSADAAATLRLLSRLWGIDADEQALLELAETLGADVPACIGSRLARGEGRGSRLTTVEDPSLDRLPVLLVNPRVPLSTPAVFAAWDGIDRGPLEAGPVLQAVLSGRNDLEPPARSLAPEIGEVLAVLQAAEDVLLARMSGSGATCFALFSSENARDHAAAMIAQDHPSWWRVATRLRAG